MKVQPKHLIAVGIVFATIVFTFWILTVDSRGIAGTFDSPLSGPPLPDPTPDLPLAPPGLMYPRGGTDSHISEPYLTTPDVVPSPLPASTTSTPTLEPRAYMPMILYNHPALLSYGPKALAGADTFNLFGDNYDAYYTWGVSPSTSDLRLARMVWCVDDYHLYEWGVASQIVQAAQSDAGDIVGRVWLVFNEPDNTWATPGTGGQCGVWPFTGDPFDDKNPSLKVWQDPSEAAVRYSMVYDWIKGNDPNARVFAGGILNIHLSQGRNWWVTFLNTLAARGELYKVEGVHVHGYPIWSTGSGCEADYCVARAARKLNAWYNNYHVGLGLGDRPIWITETGGAPFCGGWEQWDPQGWLTVRNEIMRPLSWWFTGDSRWPYGSIPTNPGYDSIHWYVSWSSYQEFWCSFLEDGRDTPAVLTPLGEYWYDFSP
jgi:hypothetical protein